MSLKIPQTIYLILAPDSGKSWVDIRFTMEDALDYAGSMDHIVTVEVKDITEIVRKTTTTLKSVSEIQYEPG